MQWRHFVAMTTPMSHDKFSSLSNKTVVAIFLNVCLWQRSYVQNWEVSTLKNCYSYRGTFSTAYVVAPYGPRFLSTVRFVKIWATCENFGQMVYRPPWQKISRTPMRIPQTLTNSNDV